MDSHLAEALEIADGEGCFETEVKTRLNTIEKKKGLKKQRKRDIEELKSKHGKNKTYSAKVLKRTKFDAEEKRRKSTKQLLANQPKSTTSLEKWCKLTGAKFNEKKQAAEKETEEVSAFDDAFFEEFSRDFLGKPEQRKYNQKQRARAAKRE